MAWPADKRYFKIGEVSKLTGVKTHVLRYWESEFRSLRPPRVASGQRLYRRQDIELIELIKRLLYQEGMTIAGAKRRLSTERRKMSKGKLLAEVQEGLKDLRNILK